MTSADGDVGGGGRGGPDAGPGSGTKPSQSLWSAAGATALRQSLRRQGGRWGQAATLGRSSL